MCVQVRAAEHVGVLDQPGRHVRLPHLPRLLRVGEEEGPDQLHLSGTLHRSFPHS